jgi:acetyl esterase/lipase
MSNWKSWLSAAIRWSLLVDATAATLLSLLTAFKCPVLLPWVVGMVVPECALWLALLPLCFATAAWFLRRGRPVLTGATLALCGVAFLLFLKPTAQARRLGRALPAQLEAAFGPAAPPQRAPFSITAAMFPRAPEPVVVETMEYANSLMLDFYRAVGRSPAPCVVVIHGGSWVGGNRKDEGTRRELNDWLARHGYAVASIDYRLAPESPWPAQRDDLLAALAFLRGHAPALGIDPARFVLLGRSAGGQMATATAYRAHDPGIRGVIAIYPPTDFRLTWDVSTEPGNLDHRLNLEWFLGGNPDTAGAAYDSASATTLVRPGAPPTLILQGKLDVNVFPRQGELLAEKLAAAGVPHALVSLPWAAHGFDLVSFNSPGGQITTYAVEWFLSAVTR